MAKEEPIVLVLPCPMIANVHLGNTSETLCPLVAAVVNLERERETWIECVCWGGGVDFISLGRVMLCFQGTVKIAEVSLLACKFIFPKPLLSGN